MRVVPFFIQFILAQLHSGQPPRRRLSAKVRALKMRRLEALEEQAASYGPNAPPEITTEIEDLRSELELVDTLDRNAFDRPMQELLGQYDPRDQIIAFFRTQSTKIRQLEQGLYDLGDRFDQWTEKREKQEQAKAQEQQRERTIGGMLTGAVLVMLGLLLILVLFMLFTR